MCTVHQVGRTVENNTRIRAISEFVVFNERVGDVVGEENVVVSVINKPIVCDGNLFSIFDKNTTSSTNDIPSSVLQSYLCKAQSPPEGTSKTSM